MSYFDIFALNYLNKLMNRIKEVLEEKGITQIWLSKKLNKSYTVVNAYVKNRRQPSIDTLFQIGEILDINVKNLLIDNRKVNDK